MIPPSANIVEIVKELQKAWTRQFWTKDWHEKVHKEFPAIAQSFLSLNENLQSMEQTNEALLKKLYIAEDALKNIPSPKFKL